VTDVSQKFDHKRAAGFSTDGHNSALVHFGLHAVSNELSTKRYYV